MWFEGGFPRLPICHVILEVCVAKSEEVSCSIDCIGCRRGFVATIVDVARIMLCVIWAWGVSVFEAYSPDTSSEMILG